MTSFPSLDLKLEQNPLQDHTQTILGLPQHDHKIEKHISHGGFKPEAKDGDNLSICEQEYGDGSKDNDKGSMNWVSSKMRLMQNMMNSKCSESDHKPLKITLKTQNHQHSDGEMISHMNNNGNNIRVCADCSTTTTPLWRSGPLGPKSLCNACGIRKRKARRALEEAGNGCLAVTCEAHESVKTKAQNNKDKKSRTSHYKKQCKPNEHHSSNHQQKKHFFKEFALSLSKSSSSFSSVLPQDEIEAAILLMELSCGLIHG